MNEIEKKIIDHGKYITTQEFNKLTSEDFAARLKQAILASKNDITDFVKKTDFDKKLKNINKKVTWNKSRHVLVENQLNNLSEKVKLVSMKRLTKHLLYAYNITNCAKYFIEHRSQNYFMF